MTKPVRLTRLLVFAKEGECADISSKSGRSEGTGLSIYYFLMEINSISKIKTAFGPMGPPAPRSP